MTKTEFLEKLRAALANDLTGAVIQENVDYYADYIRNEADAGRTEEEIIEELGDPWVIAQTIIDTAVPAGPEAVYETDRQTYGQESDGMAGRRWRGSGAIKGLLILLGVLGILFIILTVVGGIVSLVAPILIPVLIVVFILRVIRNR